MTNRTIKYKNKILETYNKLVKEIGHQNINITLLCKEAKISRQGFYLHYNSIDNILEEEIKIRANFIFEEFEKTENFDTMLKLLYDNYMEIYNNKPYLFTPEIIELSQRNLKRTLYNLICIHKSDQKHELSEIELFQIQIETKIIVNVFEILINNDFNMSFFDVNNLIKKYVNWS